MDNSCLFPGGKLCLGNSKLGRSRHLDLAKTGNPGLVRQWWGILWCGRAALTSSWNSCRWSDTHWGMERNAACRVEDGGGGVEGNLITKPFVKELGNTFRVFTSHSKIMVLEKACSQDWNWNNHEQFQEPKRKGIILEPKQDTVEPSAVSNLTREDVDYRGTCGISRQGKCIHLPVL